MESRKRTSLLTELRADQLSRIPGGRHALLSGIASGGDEAVLARAEQQVRRRIWLRKTLPLNLLLLVHGLRFIGAHPLVLVLRALLGRLLSALVGSEEILVREEYERLRGKRQSDRPRPQPD